MRALGAALAAALLGGACGAALAGETSAPLCAHAAGLRRAACDGMALGRAATLRDRSDRRRALAALAGGAALYALRDDLRDELLDDRAPGRTRVFQRGRLLAKGAAAPLAAAGFLAAWGATRDARHAETAQILLESMAGSALVAGLGSFALAADRPEDGRRVRLFRSGGHGVSLDVALAASTAGVLAGQPLRAQAEDSRARRFGKGLGRAALHAAVVLTALQRIDADKHWAPDVWLGAAAGYGVAGVLVRSHAPAVGTPHALPVLVPARGGVALVWTWSDRL